MGETVNLAQRMEAAAQPGKVLVTHETYRYTTHAIDYQALPPIQVKGKSEPIPVYEVSGVKADTPQKADQRMIGRVAELAKLQASLQRAIDGIPQVVYLIGEAGVGKSQLSSALVAGLDPELAVDAQRVRAISYEQGTTYALLRDFIRRWLGIKGQTSSDAILAGIQARVVGLAGIHPDEYERVVATIADLLGVETNHAELAQLSPQQRRIMAFRSFNTVLLASAKHRPLLLNFEDLHWADDASIEWLQTLFDALATREHQHARLMVLCQARPVDGSPIGRWKVNVDNQTLVLRAMSEAESWELLASLLELDHDHHQWDESLRQIADQVLARGEGNPLFLRELVRSLIDSGALEPDPESGWKAKGTAGGSLPSTINGVILARIDRLAPDMRALLQLASVVGRSFQPNVVATVGGNAEVEGTLEELAKAEFVLRRSNGEWQFHQALIHEVVYNSLLLATRRDLHRKVGETLERNLGDRSDESPQVLARHYLVGELTPKAIYYLFLSGQMAHRNFSNQEALNCFTECLALIEKGGDLPPRPRREEVLIAHSDLLATTGQYAVALEHLQAALALQTAPADRAETLRRLGGIYNLQGQFGEAMDHYDQGLALLDGTDNALGSARLLLDKGLSLFRQGRYADVIQLCESTLTTLEGTANLKEVAMAYSVLGIVYYRQNRQVEAETYHARAMELREEIQDVFGVASSLNNLGALYLEIGEWAKAADHYERALKIYQRIGDVSRQIIQQNNLGDLLRNQGELAEAEQCHRQALEQSEEINDSLGAGIAATGLGMVLVADHRPGEAVDSLLRGIATMEGINAVEVLPEAFAALARAYRRLEKWDEARSAVEKGLKQAHENNSHGQVGLVLYSDATLKEAQGDLTGALQAVKEAIEALGSEGAPIDVGRAYALEAKIRLAIGDPDADIRRAEALAIFRRLGAKLEIAALEEQAAAR
ncbi:MAG TPA: tetratricopeptide repeat protein, partial [Stenomitos sp.]